jgi:hypothetical protein
VPVAVTMFGLMKAVRAYYEQIPPAAPAVLPFVALKLAIFPSLNGLKSLKWALLPGASVAVNVLPRSFDPIHIGMP